MMSFSRLEKIKRLRAKYPKPALRESSKGKEYQKYLESLSEEEISDLYHQKLEDYHNSDEGLALKKRLKGMTVEELTREYFDTLKAS